MIEFTNQEDLELLDLEFEEGKVPQLGVKAFFDVENPVDPEEFIERFKHSNQS